MRMCFVCSASAAEVTNAKSTTHEDPVDPNTPTAQEAPESKHYDTSTREADEKLTDQEEKHKVDQSQEEETCADALRHHQEHEAAPDRECETCTDSAEAEDTEQVETFFSTMSHRYENATQEGHIL